MNASVKRSIGMIVTYLAGVCGGVFALTPGWSWSLWLLSLALCVLGDILIGKANETT